LKLRSDASRLGLSITILPIRMPRPERGVTLKGSDMWRYVLSGLLSIGGVILAFVASFGNPTTVLLDLPSAFQAPVIQAAVSPLASIRSPPATTLTPPPDQVSTKPPQAGPDAEKEARRLRQPPSFGDAERVVSVQPAQDNGEQIVAGEADSQAGVAALQAHVASMPPAASVIMLSEKSEAVASTSAPAQGTAQLTHPAPAHKMPQMTSVDPDRSADQLNAKELASIQHGSPAPAPMLTKSP
jgi:hypothetical protein